MRYPLPIVFAASLALPNCGGGGPRWQAPTVVDSGEGRAESYRVAIADDGHALLLWTRVQHPQPGLHWTSSDPLTAWRSPEPLLEGLRPREVVSDPVLAMNTSGTAIVVAERTNEVGRRLIWGARYVRAGGWDNGKVLDDSQRLSCCQTVAVDATGAAVAVWTLFDATGWSRFAPAQGWSAPAYLTHPAAPSPRLVLDAHGNGVLVQPGGSVTRYVSGSGWGTPQTFRVDGGTLGCPAVAINETGRAVVVWGDIQTGDRFFTFASMWAQEFDPSGRGTEAVPIQRDVGQGCAPQVVIDAAGNALAVWPSSNEIWYSRLDAGRTWASPRRVPPPPGDLATAGLLEGDDSGNAFLTWTTGAFGSRDAWVTRYESGGHWQDPEPLETGAADDEMPFVAATPGGEAVVVWSQSEQGRYSLMARRFAAN